MILLAKLLDLLNLLWQLLGETFLQSLKVVSSVGALGVLEISRQRTWVFDEE
jgi:hypothetical protein